MTVWAADCWGYETVRNVSSCCTYKLIKFRSICGGIWVCVLFQVEKGAKCFRQCENNKLLFQSTQTCFSQQFFFLLPSLVLAWDPDPHRKETWLFCWDALNWLNVIVRGCFLRQTLEAHSVSDGIAIFLTDLTFFTSQLMKQVKQPWLVCVMQGFGEDRGGRRTTASTGSGHYSSRMVQVQYLWVPLIANCKFVTRAAR